MVAKKFIKHKQLSRAALCFLCLFVALSFVAPLLPIANASLRHDAVLRWQSGPL